MPELTPVEIVGYEVDETGSPLSLDNGLLTTVCMLKNIQTVSFFIFNKFTNRLCGL